MIEKINPTIPIPITSSPIPDEQRESIMAKSSIAIPNPIFFIVNPPLQIPIHNVRVRSIRPCSFPLKWRYGLTNFPIGTPRPQTNVSASLHCFVLDSASWDIAPVSRLNMCVLWKSWIAINRNERRNVNARSRNRYFQVKKCSSHLKPRRINAHKSF